MAKAQDDYDCTSCGACCISNWVPPTSYAAVSDSDARRILAVIDPAIADEIIANRGSDQAGTSASCDGVQAMKTKVNSQGLHVCVALKGEVGSCVSCQIYEYRPGVCREFQAYTDDCKDSRKRAGIED